MPAGVRLSAVAKRRRLNGNVSVAVESPADVNLSPTAKSPEPVQPQISVESQAVYRRTEESDSNSFAPLLNGNLAQYTDFREIEKLNDSALRIRLSKGQRCIISGSYALWVKNGSIRINGATINGSDKLYFVDFSLIFEVPPITALSKAAEFEIQSRTDSLPVGFVPSSQKWASEATNELYHASFLVHGYSSITERHVATIVRDFDDGFASIISRQSSLWDNMNDRIPAPVLLFCGKQSVGSASSFLAVVNSIITARHPSKSASFTQGVLVLDLDSDLPTFAPPGTISLAHVQEPILGSPYMNLGVANSSNKTDKVKLVLLYRAHSTRQNTNRSQHLDFVFDDVNRLRAEKFQTCPLIIKSKSLLEEIVPLCSRVTKAPVPNIVLLSSPEGGTKHSRLAERIQEHFKELTVVDLPLPASRSPSLIAQHEILLQSYFHFHGYQASRPQWSGLPLELNQKRHIWFSYATKSTLTLLASLPCTQLDIDDILEAVTGLVVMIVLHEKGDDDRLYNISLQKGHSQGHYDTEMDAVATEGSCCLGLGIIAGFDKEVEEICIITPILPATFNLHQRQGNRIDLFVQHTHSDGRFDTAWTQLELETILEQKQSGLSVCKRNMNIGRQKHT